ncbi:hypothetical protein P8452_56242 [Trifolium repens]|nr:hypothetical protein P8452_56242 [Trifolium repens]
MPVEERIRGGARSSRAETSLASGGADSSSASGTNDWKHWVALQGDDTKVAADVAEFTAVHRLIRRSQFVIAVNATFSYNVVVAVSDLY